MMLYGLMGSLVFYILLTAFTAETANHPDLAYGTIVSIYCFGICFAWGFTPLQTLYAVECLENRTRAKGSGANFLLYVIIVFLSSMMQNQLANMLSCTQPEHRHGRQHLRYRRWYGSHWLEAVPRLHWLVVRRDCRHLLLLRGDGRQDPRGDVGDLRGQEPEKGQHPKDQGRARLDGPCGARRQGANGLIGIMIGQWKSPSALTGPGRSSVMAAWLMPLALT